MLIKEVLILVSGQENTVNGINIADDTLMKRLLCITEAISHERVQLLHSICVVFTCIFNNIWKIASVTNLSQKFIV